MAPAAAAATTTTASPEQCAVHAPWEAADPAASTTPRTSAMAPTLSQHGYGKVDEPLET